MKTFKKFARPYKYFLVRSVRKFTHISIRALNRFDMFFAVLWFILVNPVPVKRTRVLGKLNYIRSTSVRSADMRVAFSRWSLMTFALFAMPKIHVCVIGVPGQKLQGWSTTIHKKLRATVSSYDGEAPNWSDIRLERLASDDGRPVLLVDAAQTPLSIWQVIELMHALIRFDAGKRIGVITPAALLNSRVINGIGFDRNQQTWKPLNHEEDSFRQSLIPRYVLAAQMHGAIVSPAFLRAVLPSESESGVSDVDGFSDLIRLGWLAGYRCLSYPQVQLELTKYPIPRFTGDDEEWLTSRNVVGADGRTRIIFVLPATTLSGGIRVVFEKAQGLIQRGFCVEVWSLFSDNAWSDIDVPIRRFPTFDILGHALEQVHAIKVATWWETADVVFLASVSRGIPAQFVQEFETWFYPDTALDRAGVVASYRPEFDYLTTATFQQDELRSIGVEASLIPVGFDNEIYRLRDDVEREPQTVVAIGRSFFQKNFSMTVNAWKALPKPRPKFIVFSGESAPFSDPDLEFISRPSNERVNEIYNRGSVFVQTSRHEGFCLPILEAMAAGCVVITTDSHGNRGFCQDGYNCVVVDQDDVEGLSRSIARVLSDEILMSTLRTNALMTAREYAWPRVLDTYAEVYQQLAEKG